jgi:hypothetical protein
MDEFREKYRQEQYDHQYRWLIENGAKQDNDLLIALIAAKKLAEEVDIFCKICGEKLTAWDIYDANLQHDFDDLRNPYYRSDPGHDIECIDCATARMDYLDSLQ